MWWFPIAAGVAVIAVVGGLAMLYNRQTRRAAYQYRSYYQRLMIKLEKIVVRVNTLGGMTSLVKSNTLLHYAEGCFRLFEELLGKVASLRDFSSDIASLRAATYLAKRIEKKLLKLEDLFNQHLRGEEVLLENLIEENTRKQMVTGCYFCSRPYQREGFKIVRVRIAKSPLFVYGCQECRATLRESKKINVLFFEKDGKQMHWSEVKDYVPAKDYWAARTGSKFRALNFEAMDRFDY